MTDPITNHRSHYTPYSPLPPREVKPPKIQPQKVPVLREVSPDDLKPVGWLELEHTMEQLQSAWSNRAKEPMLLEGNPEEHTQDLFYIALERIDFETLERHLSLLKR